MSESIGTRYLVSYQYRPRFNHGHPHDPVDYIDVWDKHPVLVITEMRNKPDVPDAIGRLPNEITRIYSITPIPALFATHELLDSF